MGVTEIGFIALVALVGILRIAELRVSRKHQREMLSQGASRVSERRFGTMVFLHTAVLIGAVLEVLLLHRLFYPWLAVPMCAFFVASNAVRIWVIRTLGKHWNVQVMNSAPLGVVSSGPYRWVRHPNYSAVFVEMFALPLIHTAWITAIFAAVGNALVLRWRLKAEDPMLLANADYRTSMGGKPRFIPKFL
ncbi:MAG TPA: isoprenylcysteine carboxylmethyltransferase family protein [Candidatus Acidoferrales bacterium]|nr:isoprenylcysteine carboxylmethyltransferase family protein [Candidatus Acidoferrales bacterium]